MNAIRYRCRVDTHAGRGPSTALRTSATAGEIPSRARHLPECLARGGILRAVRLGLCLLAALSVLAAAGRSSYAQSGGDYDLTWWTADVGGGVTAGGVFTLHGTAGQSEPWPTVTGGGFTLTGGFWPGGPASPLAVADLRASQSGGFLRLDWTAVTQDVEDNSIVGATYNVYRAADAPYFTAGAPYASGVALNTYTDPDGNVIGNTQHSHYYLVRAVHSGPTSTDSNRVGCFAFGLTPGTP